MTTSFSVTRDDVIKASLRVLGVLGAADTPSTEDFANCNQALNMYIKTLQTRGMPLWKIEDVQVPMVSGKVSYSIGNSSADVTSDRPLRVITAFIRDNSSHFDTTLQLISRQEYMMQSNKQSASVPNQVYYDLQLPNGVLYVFGVPTDATRTIHLQCQLPIGDMVKSTDTFDFPQEFFSLLKFGLADQLSLEYGVPKDVRAEVAQRAMMLQEELMSWAGNDDTSTFFTVETRWQR